MRHPHPASDSWGHVPSERERRELTAAIETLNASDTVDAMEESANLHHAADFRAEMATALHVADVPEWEPSEHEPDDLESGVCGKCGGVVTRRQLGDGT